MLRWKRDGTGSVTPRLEKLSHHPEFGEAVGENPDLPKREFSIVAQTDLGKEITRRTERQGTIASAGDRIPVDRHVGDCISPR